MQTSFRSIFISRTSTVERTKKGAPKHIIAKGVIRERLET